MQSFFQQGLEGLVALSNTLAQGKRRQLCHLAAPIKLETHRFDAVTTGHRFDVQVLAQSLEVNSVGMVCQGLDDLTR